MMVAFGEQRFLIRGVFARKTTRNSAQIGFFVGIFYFEITKHGRISLRARANLVKGSSVHWFWVTPWLKRFNPLASISTVYLSKRLCAPAIVATIKEKGGKKQSSIWLAAQAGRRLARPWLRSQWWASPPLSPPSHSLCCALPFSPAPEWQAGGRGRAAAMMAKSLHLLLRAAASTSKGRVTSRPSASRNTNWWLLPFLDFPQRNSDFWFSEKSAMIGWNFSHFNKFERR